MAQGTKDTHQAHLQQAKDDRSSDNAKLFAPRSFTRSLSVNVDERIFDVILSTDTPVRDRDVDVPDMM
jgi:hypothetical protein